ncbi:MAG: hypothetical protein LC808_35705, partial [Actinobacteria bacterium]|nr:hypothetical protein [Actinomycetota bacterium]
GADCEDRQPGQLVTVEFTQLLAQLLVCARGLAVVDVTPADGLRSSQVLREILARLAPLGPGCLLSLHVVGLSVAAFGSSLVGEGLSRVARALVVLASPRHVGSSVIAVVATILTRRQCGLCGEV